MRARSLRSGLARLGLYLGRGGAAYGVLVISLLLTALAWYYVRQNVEAQTRARFDETTEAIQEAIERRTQAYLDATFGARGLFYASESVTRAEWGNYVEGIEPNRRFKGLQALSYAEYVTPGEREAFALRASEEGLPGLRPDLDPGGERDAYFPITYTGPLNEANERRLNYDFYAEAEHREVMNRARDSGSPRATKIVYVLADAPRGSEADLALRPGFVVYLPIYEKGEPLGTVAERRRALRGFVVGSFISDELLEGIFKGSFHPLIDFEVFDGASPASSPLLYDSDGILRGREGSEENAAPGSRSPEGVQPGETSEDALFSKVSRFEVAGREWSLYFATLPQFEEGAKSNLPAFVLASGAGVSLLLFGITWMLVRSRTRAERTSKDLEKANRELESFYHSVEDELRMARRIQHALLPKNLPELEGWKIAYHYQPAREVGGDFYDFLSLENGHLGLVIGDVSGKGIAAALVMANAQSVLRAVARRGNITPGQVLEEANEVLTSYIPPNTFITCFYGVLDPESGRLVYANAGHNLPCERHDGRVDQLLARGMPLGLMPGMEYEVEEAVLAAGDDLLFYSDGLTEAHDPSGEMFGAPRLQHLLREHGSSDAKLMSHLLSALARFTGKDWEQEDDITLVILERSRARVGDHELPSGSDAAGAYRNRRILAEFSLPSEPGNERMAMEKVASAVSGLGLHQKTMDRLKTAVAEATMNAMEHGNGYDPEIPVGFQLSTSDTELFVRITDQGGTPVPDLGKQMPDIEAKLMGAQTPRGWGLFLIQNMVDEVRVSGDLNHHTTELVLRLTTDSVTG